MIEIVFLGLRIVHIDSLEVINVCLRTLKGLTAFLVFYAITAAEHKTTAAAITRVIAAESGLCAVGLRVVSNVSQIIVVGRFYRKRLLSHIRRTVFLSRQKRGIGIKIV